METNRKEERKNANAFIGVYELNSENLIGYLLDLNTFGIKLKSTDEIEIDTNFEFRLELPIEIDGSSSFLLNVSSVWCYKHNNSRYYETGFEIIYNSPEEKKKIELLFASELFELGAEKLHITLGMVRQ